MGGCIGPFSLAGRLMDVSEAMINCYEEPEMVHIVLKKATKFLIDYISAYKEAGADGIFNGRTTSWGAIASFGD